MSNSLKFCEQCGLFNITIIKALLLLGLVALANTVAVASDWGPDLKVESNTVNGTDSKNLDTVRDFVTQGLYKEWPHDPYIRPTGDIYQTPGGDLIDGTTHHRVRIYYSPNVANWLERGRPSGEVLPDRSMIVKEMYSTLPPVYPNADPVIGWAAMVKKNGASHDGWYWLIYFKPGMGGMQTVGEFSYSFCLTCHASTKDQTTFADVSNLSGKTADLINTQSYIEVANPLFSKELFSSTSMSAMAELGDKHLKTSSSAFNRLYGPDSGIYCPDGESPCDAPKYNDASVEQSFPSVNFDHVWNTVKPASNSYLTSDNCVGCHDATLLVSTQVPNMLVKRPLMHSMSGQTEEMLNLSVYGEWRASPMGMAGRDPIFFAQLESEVNTYPEYKTFIENKCLSCHGAMGQRQYEEDTDKKDFSSEMVFLTEGHNAKYGALAREGISCMVCHQMDPESVATTNSGNFKRGPADIIYGSTAPDEDVGGPIRTHPMQSALGFTPTFNEYLNDANMCGTCHTIELDVLTPEQGRYHADSPVLADNTVLLSEAHEQDTFLEWRYSGYQNVDKDKENPEMAQTCQACHMSPELQGNGSPVNFRVANVENDSWPKPPALNLASPEKITVPPRPHVGRHTFFGMNLFVLSFYDQFAKSVFGLVEDPNPPMGTVDSFKFALENGQWQIENQTASVSIDKVLREENDLVVTVKVVNKAGHRLPSGVGFRRAWLELQVKDDKKQRVWGSGMTDDQGVIVGADGITPLESEFTEDWQKLQPHWQTITRQDQVQIYEERYINSYGDKLKLNTSFLGIGKVTKSNRLQPQGYMVEYLKEKLAQAKADPTQDDEEKWQSLLTESAWESLPAGAINPADDDNYKHGLGSDEVTYRIPLAELEGKNALSVHARLNYQNIPPYYLRDRFNLGRGKATQRLYYLVGHTDVEDTAIDGWKIEITGDDKFIPRSQ